MNTIHYLKYCSLLIECGSYIVLLCIAALTLVVLLQLNLHAGTVMLGEQFPKTTVNQIPKGMPLLLIQFPFDVVV
jgi:hypothetical protein